MSESSNVDRERAAANRAAMRGPVYLLLAGQLLFIAVTFLHTGGDANNHRAIFAAYAADETWIAVHLAQFAAMAILFAGLFALFGAFDTGGPEVEWRGRLKRMGAAVTVAAFALYGALQAVDGVALKRAVTAWAQASGSEKPARFASAESIRWLEWGMRSYHDFAFGLALLLCAAAAARTECVPRGVAMLMGLSGLCYCVQGWIAGTDGFSKAHALAIVVVWALNLSWMVWLTAAARR